MKKLIIYGHPNEKSFCSAIGESYKDGAIAAWYEVEIMDLYKNYSQNYLSFVDKTNAESTKLIQQKIDSADELCFVFPVWNFSEPAIVKNFWDVNFIKWYSFKNEDGKNIWLLKGKKGRVIMTAGADIRIVKFLLKIVSSIVRWQWRFGFSGMDNLWTDICLNAVNPQNDSGRKVFLTYIYSLGMK